MPAAVDRFLRLNERNLSAAWTIKRGNARCVVPLLNDDGHKHQTLVLMLHVWVVCGEGYEQVQNLRPYLESKGWFRRVLCLSIDTPMVGELLFQ